MTNDEEARQTLLLLGHNDIYQTGTFASVDPSLLLSGHIGIHQVDRFMPTHTSPCHHLE